MLYFSRWKTGLILAVVVIGMLFAAPNVMGPNMRASLPGFVPSSPINLGLDLQGGSHLLYEVDLDEVRQDRLEATQAEARVALREARIAARSIAVDDDGVVVRLSNPADGEAALAALEELSEPIGTAPTQVGFGAGARTLDVRVRNDGAITLSVTPEALEDIRTRTVRQSIEVIRLRIDAFGTSEPLIQRQGENRVLVQAPGVDDPERLKQQIGTTAKLTFHMVISDNPADVAAAASGRVSPFQLLAPTDNPSEPQILINRRPALTGERLRRATQGFHPDSGEPVVNFTFDTSGSTTFCRLTQENVNRRFAIKLDELVITAPVIRSAICGGTGFIEGNFTVDSARDLSALLDSGALPARLTIVEERTVGAGLGADSIAAGRIALIIGFAAVIVYMLLSYGIFGVFANAALLANVALIAGALSGIGATLTLPGIAGIILTIGMAVDANVLIFERIREEARLGRSPINAVEAGFLRARSAIFDANFTTLVAAVVLYWLGSGPVQGFAVTLGIGIVTSVFTAFVFSRLLVATWFRQARPRALPI